MRTPKIGRASEVLRARARPISIWRAICPGLLRQKGKEEKYMQQKNLFFLATIYENTISNNIL